MQNTMRSLSSSRVILISILCAFPAALVAQQSPSLPQQSPEIGRLAELITGKWATTEQYAPSAMYQHATRGTGTDVIRGGPGDLSIVSDYHSTNAYGKFAGHGVISWDQKTASFTLYWIDNTSPQPTISSGKWEGNSLVFTDDLTSSDGQPMYVKQTYSNFTPNSFTFTQESSIAGGPLKRDTLVQFRRAVVAASTSSSTRKKKKHRWP
jgi:Protein of unknown function (DUF1579)